jgi:hypothetical protein
MAGHAGATTPSSTAPSLTRQFKSLRVRVTEWMFFACRIGEGLGDGGGSSKVGRDPLISISCF